MTKYEEMTIADILKNFLNLERKREMIDGKRAWKWFNSRDVKAEEPVPSSMSF